MTKKPMKLLSLLLSASLALGMGSFPVLAQEAEVTAVETAEAGETVSPDIENEDGEEFRETDLQEEEAAEDAAQAEEESLDESLDDASGEGEAEEEAADERAEEETVEQTEQADDAETVEEPETVEESAAFEEPETADTAETVETAPGTEEVVVTEPAAEAEAAAKQMTLVTIGGIRYYYVNTEGDAEDTVYQAVERSGAGSTSYDFTIADLTQVSGTNYCYTVLTGVTPLSGTLYGYGEGTTTNYKEVYENLGVSTDSDSAYDAVTSATSFGGYHAKDIPSLVSFGTADGEKAITGLTLGRASSTVDAVTYVEASILNAAGEALTDEQTAALATILKANPMSAPVEEEIGVGLASASFQTSRYGSGEFVIVPDDSASGYSWNEYWNSVYAATISNGETTVGAVHWIDMYGEAATSGRHYNRLEIALNNGTSIGSNKAEVSRYAAFFDANTGNIKPGTYAISVYAEGYSTLTAEVEVKAEAMSTVSIGGVNYYYADTTDDDAMTVYQATVRSRAGSTAYNYMKTDLTRVTDTDLYYIPAPGAAALEGTLYGYEAGSGNATNYKEVYGNLGANTDVDSAYDAVTSATGFTGHHAKDIPSLVTFGTSGGEKAITGLALGRTTTTVDALTYVEASVKQAAGKELTEEQAAAAAVTLTASPMTAPSDKEISVKLASASLTTSRYGKAEFAIVPDDSVSGYVWSNYWNNIYGATISDGKTTVGAVHWIDLYGEAATSGPHYNKVEIALNNGTSTGSNEAAVTRYASFFDGNYIKSGTYTITIYAEGYSPLTAQVAVDVKLSDKTAAYNGSAVTADKAVLNGIDGDVTYTYYSDADCTKALDSAPVNSGTYYVKAAAANLVTSSAAKLTINKAAQSFSVSGAPSVESGKTTKINAVGAKETSTYYFASSNTSVAAVAGDGTVTGINPGTASITISTPATANYNAATWTVTINVIKNLKKPGYCHFVKWNNKNYTGCRIAWNRAVGAEGYQTQLCWTNGSHESITNVGPNTLYRDCKVYANHVSLMRVRAFYTFNGQRIYGPWSNMEFITPSPKKLTCKNVSSGKDLKMKVSWPIIYGSNGYNVFITTNPNGKWSWNQSTAVKANATSAVITKCMGAKLKKNTRYYVRIVTRRKFKGVFCSVPMPAANTTTGSFIIK